MSHFEEMRTFVRIVEAGSISQAAEQLGIAKSGVSRRLTDLESRLGVRLINRTTRRSSLTEAGRSYYTGAVKLLADVAELDASTADAEASLKGRLRLAVPLSFGLAHLAPAIDGFLRKHPGLDLDIDFSDRKVDLVERGVDLAIRIAQLEDSNLQARRLCPIRLLLCASPAYLDAHGRPEHPADLENHRVLRYAASGGSAIRLPDGAGGEVLVQAEAPIIANNGDFLRDMAVAGQGITLIPSFIAWQALATGDLVEVMGGHAPAPLNAWAVYPRNRYLSRRARLFIDFLAERFGDQPYWDA
ncbi:MAG: LysR family transcriptional regulator [Xanthomonadales bacterium]